MEDDVFPFRPRVDYLTPDVSALPLSELFFCDTSDLPLAPTELVEEIDSYYCPHCLQNLPSREATGYGMRCPKCYDCVRCGATLTIAQVRALEYTLMCPGCRWQPGPQLRTKRPEDLVKLVLAREDASTQKSVFANMKRSYQEQAQQTRRQKELFERVRRQSITAQAELLGGASPLGKSDARPWRLQDLDQKLAVQKEQRTADKPTLSEGAATFLTPAEVVQLHGGDIRDELPKSKKKEDKQDRATDSFPREHGYLVFDPDRAKPELAGELISRSVWKDRGLYDREGGRFLLTDGAPVRGVCGPETVSRLATESIYLYGPDSSSSKDHNLRNAAVEGGASSTTAPALPAPSAYRFLASQKLLVEQESLSAASGVPFPQHRFVHNLALPLRKPLLTKRSKRCKYSGRIVVKPQINPCSVPPFQKENVASKFLPHIAVSVKRTPGRADLQHALMVTGEATVFLVLANPLDVPVDVTLAELTTEERSTEDILADIAKRTSRAGLEPAHLSPSGAAAELSGGRRSSQSPTKRSSRAAAPVRRSPALLNFAQAEIQPDSAVNRAVVRLYRDAVLAREEEQQLAPQDLRREADATAGPRGGTGTAQSSLVQLPGAVATGATGSSILDRSFESGFQQEDLTQSNCRAFGTPGASLQVALLPLSASSADTPRDEMNQADARQGNSAAVVDRKGCKVLVKFLLRQTALRRRKSSFLARENTSEDEELLFYLKVRASYTDPAGRRHTIVFPLRVRI